MSPPRNLLRTGTTVMSSLMILLGVAIVVSTLAAGGGPLAFGIIIGVLFVAAGAARLYLARKVP